MSLTTLEAVNNHLPKDKLGVLNADDDAPMLSAERMVKGKLSGTFAPATLALWTTPEDTPEFIEEIAARLVAAQIYARAFSSEGVGLPEYAQWLYDTAMEDLQKIIDGLITLPEVEEVVDTGGRFTQDFFWPNDSTSTEGRFTMQDVF